MKKLLFALSLAFLWAGNICAQELTNYADIQPTQITYAKARILEITELSDGEEGLQEARLEFLNGEKKGDHVIAGHEVYGPVAPRMHKGDTVLVYIEYDPNDDTTEYFIRDMWRLDRLLLWGGLFILLICAIAGLKGIRALIALFASIAIVLVGMFPLIYAGWDPLIILLGGGILFVLVNVPLIHGWNRKSLVTVAAVTLTFLLCLLLTLLMMSSLRLTGLSDEEPLFLGQLIGYDVMGHLFSAAVVLGAMGAILDICMSVSTGLYEITQHHPHITRKKLQTSGMNIGRDMMASMLNTLVFAYIGASVVELLLLYKMEVGIIEILNFQNLVEEITRSLVGAFGLAFAIPITSWIGGMFFVKK